MEKYQLNVCLGFMGQTEEALTFYSKVFNVPVLYTMKYKDFTLEGIRPEDGEKVGRMALDFGHMHLCGEDLNVLRPSDESVSTEYDRLPRQFFSITLDNQQEVDAIATHLSEGGHIIVPFAPQFFAPYYGRLVDRYGVGWELDVAFDEGEYA